MGLDNYLLILDETLTSILGDWDIYSTTIATVVLVLFAWRIFTSRDLDTHPMLLARQAQPSSIRQQHESPIYRSQSAPHGMDLNSGLNIKDEGVSKWARGRSGDLRDVWRKIVAGAADKDGKPTEEIAKIMTVTGSDITEHHLNSITNHIIAIGRYISGQDNARVAIYLPNSLEFVIALFACSFYNATPILLPYITEPSDIANLLKSSAANVLIAPAGTLDLNNIQKTASTLENVIYVQNPGNDHVDFTPDTKNASTPDTVTWQAILDKVASSDTDTTLPATTTGSPPPGLVTFWNNTPIEYSQANLAAAISAQINIIPISQRITPADLVFPADALSTLYTLVVTLAACYCNASLVLSSIAGPNADLISATAHISPTIIVATPDSLKDILRTSLPKVRNSLSKTVHWFQSRSLQQDGVMPSNNMVSRLNSWAQPSLGVIPRKLRLVFVAEQAGLNKASLNSIELSHLRVFTGARFGYALTASKVAGAISQTAIYDYRVDDVVGHRPHFGSPLSSVEIYFRDTKDKKSTDQMSIGEICVRGPAVVDGHARLGIDGMMREDMTLAYA